MKIGLFVQDKSPEKCNKKEFEKEMKKIAESKLDLLVFPEECYTDFSKMASNFDVLDYDSGYIIAGFCDALCKKAGSAIVYSGNDMFGISFNMFSDGADEDSDEGMGFKLYIKHFHEGFSPFEMDDYKEWAEAFFKPFPITDKLICMMDGDDAKYSALSTICNNNGAEIFINVLDADADYNESFTLNKVRAAETKSFVFGLTPADGEKSGAFVFGFAPDGSLMEGTPIYDNGKIAGNVFVYDTENYNSENVSICEKDEVLAENPDFVLDCETVEELLKSANKVADNIFIKDLNNINLVMILVKNEEIMNPVITLDAFYNPALKDIENKRYLLINKWDSDFGEYDGVIDDVIEARTIENRCASVLCGPDYKKCCQIDKNGQFVVIDGEQGRFGLTMDVVGGPEFIWSEENGGFPESWREYYEDLIKVVHGENIASDEPVKKEVNFDIL